MRDHPNSFCPDTPHTKHASFREPLSKTLDFDFSNFTAQEQKEYQSNIDRVDQLASMSCLTTQMRERMRDALVSLSSSRSTSKEQSEDGMPLTSVSDAETLLDIFGPERIRRYFNHLSGSDKDLPYAMVLPVHDSDLESYLLYEFCKDFPQHQDQCVLDYVDEPLERVGINLLISRLKANPEFLLRLSKESRINNPSMLSYSYINHFLRKIESDLRFNESHRVLHQLIMDPKRQRLASDALRLNDARKKLRRLDERFLEPYFQE